MPRCRPGREGSRLRLRPGEEAIEKSDRIRKIIYCLLILCLLGSIIGCHHRQDEGSAVPEGKTVFDRIAVVPFQQIIPEDLSQGIVRCPLCGRIFGAAKADGNPETVIEDLFLKYLKESKPTWNVIAGERVAGAYRRVSAASLKNPHRRSSAMSAMNWGRKGSWSGISTVSGRESESPIP
jgi:hypothetical protein